MNVLLGFAFCLPLVLSTPTVDISSNNEIDNDFVNIETFEDYGGDIVPYVEDLYVGETETNNDVVEEITVNQTIVDNTEVLEKMDILDNRLTLLNNNFNSVLSSGISSDDSYLTFEESDYLIDNVSACAIMNGKVFYNVGAPFYMRAFDVSDKNTLMIDWEEHNLQYVICGTDIPPSEIPSKTLLDFSEVCPIVHNIYPNEQGYDTSMIDSIDVSNYDYVVFNVACGDDMFFPSIRYPRGSSSSSVTDNDPSVNVSYPQEVIYDVNTIKNELITLQYLTVLNITLPMVIACVKKITFPNRKEINK